MSEEHVKKLHLKCIELFKIWNNMNVLNQWINVFIKTLKFLPTKDLESEVIELAESFCKIFLNS